MNMLKTVLFEAPQKIISEPYNVVLFNDDTHDMVEVSRQIQKATGCHPAKAMSIMFEAHATGRAIAFTGNKEHCEHVESILTQINLGTEIERA